jgi:tRNA A-37 threonylcarbamoyl transferase component Bud32
VLGDLYLSGSRPFEELRVSEAARAAGVPVPECLAVIVRRRGPLYSGDVIVREVASAVSLEEWLRRHGAPPAELVAALGDAFAKLFAANIHHRDLHAGNVLVQDAGGALRVFIIDFDKARQFPSLPEAKRNAMLFRFNRALVKRGLAPEPVSLRTRARLCRRLGLGEGGKTARFLRACRAHLRRHAWRYPK